MSDTPATSRGHYSHTIGPPRGEMVARLGRCRGRSDSEPLWVQHHHQSTATPTTTTRVLPSPTITPTHQTYHRTIGLTCQNCVVAPCTWSNVTHVCLYVTHVCHVLFCLSNLCRRIWHLG